MRWASWALGILGVVQYAVIAYLNRDGAMDYVSTDMAYLVMWLAVMGGLLLCYLSCGDCYGGGCGCCGDDCGCGDCGDCTPNGNGHEGHGHEGHGHEGHSH